jgi:alcohol dehydrogenase
MTPFDFQCRTRIVFGSDKIDTLGQLAGELGARRALVVSDPGIVRAGHTQRGIDALVRAGIETHLFDQVHENPTTDVVAQGVRVAHRYDPELLVGLGGGSSMDCAKGINFIFSNGGQMRDYWGVGKALRPMLPMIAVPTTAGTGSETQSFALISDAQTRVKMACGDKKAAFRAAILDPTLTQTQPATVTALTGIDALAHALETYVTTRRNPASLAFSREAWHLLSGNFIRVLQAPDDLQARGAMQIGACFAGMAVENSMLGAAHALANPLTAAYGIVHGHAVGIMLPHVVRWNGQHFPEWYDELRRAGDFVGPPLAPRAASESSAEYIAQFVTGLAQQAQLVTRLSQCDVKADALPRLAAEAMTQWTGSFNPVPVTEADYLRLYQQAY